MKEKRKEYIFSQLSSKNRLKYQGRTEMIEKFSRVIKISH